MAIHRPPEPPTGGMLLWMPQLGGLQRAKPNQPVGKQARDQSPKTGKEEFGWILTIGVTSV